MLVRLQECLLGCVQIGPVERCPARHRAHREHPHAGPLAAEVGRRLIPVYLGLVTQHGKRCGGDIWRVVSKP